MSRHVNMYMVPQQSITYKSVGNKTDLIVPANDWSVYGVTIGYCASKNHTYVITNPGENCSTCLRLPIEPSASEHCVNSVINVTVSTNHSYVHNINDTVTLLINDIPCNDSEIVICDESGNDIFHHSFTATNSGNITIEAYTNYWGADWYSDGKEMTIVVCKNGTTAKNKAIPIIISTSVTVTSVFLLLLLSLPGIKKLGALWKQNQTAKPFLLNNSCDTINAENRLCRIGSEIKTNPIYEISSISDIDGDTSPPEFKSFSKHPTLLPMEDVPMSHDTVSPLLNPSDFRIKCPLPNGKAVFGICDHKGGVLTSKDYDLRITIPMGAIEDGHAVKLYIARDIYGPFHYQGCPNNLASPFYWIATTGSYHFQKPVQVEFEHFGVVTDPSHYHLLTCEDDSESYTMRPVDYPLEFTVRDDISWCTFQTNHFCSHCLFNSQVDVPKRVSALYLKQENFNNLNHFRIEIWFSFPLSLCLKRNNQLYKKRCLTLDSSYIFEVSCDKNSGSCFKLEYREDIHGWTITNTLPTVVKTENVNFNNHYTNMEDLEASEDNLLFPPRFILNVERNPECTINLNTKINVTLDNIEQDQIISCPFNLSVSASVVNEHSTISILKSTKSISLPQIPSHICNKSEPLLRELVLYSSKISHCWEDVALQLKIPKEKIRQIEVDFPQDTNSRCRRMFSVWQERAESPLCWCQFINALYLIELNEVALEAQKHLSLKS